MTDPQIFDVGLQPERTLLAWRRTCLVLALGVAVAIRFGPLADPVLVLVLGIPALALIAVAYALTSVRYRTATRLLSSDPRAAVAGGRGIAIVTVVALAIGVLAAAFVVTSSEVFA